MSNKEWPEWPGVDEAVAALREAFGNAEVIHTGGPCYSIQVVLEDLGLLWVGDMNGPLGESDEGWGVELKNTNWEYLGQVCDVPDRSVSKLIEEIRAFLRHVAPNARNGFQREATTTTPPDPAEHPDVDPQAGT